MKLERQEVRKKKIYTFLKKRKGQEKETFPNSEERLVTVEHVVL